MISKMSQTRERQMPHDLTYMWNVKNQNATKQNKPNTEHRLVVARGRGRGWITWVKRVKRYKFPVIK